MIGCAVSSTGIGGGVLLLPVLIVLLHVPPLVAVGTALVYMSATKTFALLLHWRQGTVDMHLARYLCLGSVPAVLVGSFSLRLILPRFGDHLDRDLRIAVAICILLVAGFSLIASSLKRKVSSGSHDGNLDALNAVWIGALGGFVVSVTSIGSGSVIVLLLLIFCPRAPAILVGTDIFHGVILATVGWLTRIGTGQIDWRLVSLLLAGSVAGVPLGTYVASICPAVWLRRTLLFFAVLGGLATL
jgi:uncharacterized protein